MIGHEFRLSLLRLSLVYFDAEDVFVLAKVERGVLEEFSVGPETAIVDSLILHDGDAADLLWVNVEATEEVVESGNQTDANSGEHSPTEVSECHY